MSALLWCGFCGSPDECECAPDEPACPGCGAPTEEQCECLEAAPFDLEHGFTRFSTS